MPRLLPLLALACGTPQGLSPFEDDAGVDDTEQVVAGPECKGKVVLDWALAPAPFATDPARWEQDGLALLLTGYGEPEPGLPSFVVSRNEAGCIVVEPGAFGLDTTATGCAAKAVAVTVTDACGGGCTQVRALAGAETVASTANSRSGTEEVLQLSPAQPFNLLAMASLGATICRVELTQTALPEALRPPDTDDDF